MPIESQDPTSGGGVGGLLSDVFGGRNKYRARTGGYKNQTAETERALGLESRGQEQEFTSYLRDAAQGKVGPSVAENQLAQSTAAAQRAASGMAASARGPNRALAMRSAVGAQGRLQGQANAQAATLRAQEGMAREQMVAEALRQRRLADMQARGMSIEEANAQLQAEMKAQEINAGIASGNAEQAGSYGGAALMAIGSLFSDARSKVEIDSTPLELGNYQPPAKKDSGLLGGLLSDAKAKDLIDENTELKAALRAATGAPSVDFRAAPARRFVYKDPEAPGAAPGPQVGTNAQDLERTDARAAVIDTPRGKMVDPGRVTMALAPAVGEEQRRSDEQDARIASLEESLRAVAAGGAPIAKGQPDTRMEIGYDPRPGVAGLYRVQGSTIGEAPEDEAYRRAAGGRR